MDTQPKLAWYLVSAVSGKEDQVVEALKNRIVSEEIIDCFDNEATSDGAFKIFKKPTLTAREQEKKNKGEEYKIKWVNMYGGYIFIRMRMTDEAWFVIRNTQYVTGLVGSSGRGAKPTPVSDKEIEKMFKAEQKAIVDFDNNSFQDRFSKNDIVEITEGPFVGEIGKVISINEITKTVQVEIEMFGKRTPIELKAAFVKLSNE